MSLIAEKLRAARRIEIQVGDITFTGMRATPEQYSRSLNASMTDAEVCRLHIDGAEGAKESDLIEGGAKTAWKFNREDFSEVIAEKPEWYKPLVSAIIKDAEERFLKKAENQKN